MTKNDNYISIAHIEEAQDRHETNGGESKFFVRELEVFEIIINLIFLRKLMIDNLKFFLFHFE